MTYDIRENLDTSLPAATLDLIASMMIDLFLSLNKPNLRPSNHVDSASEGLWEWCKRSNLLRLWISGPDELEVMRKLIVPLKGQNGATVSGWGTWETESTEGWDGADEAGGDGLMIGREVDWLRDLLSNERPNLLAEVVCGRLGVNIPKWWADGELFWLGWFITTELKREPPVEAYCKQFLHATSWWYFAQTETTLSPKWSSISWSCICEGTDTL